MDRFTRYALITMITAVAIIVICTYVGVFIFGGDMETRYVAIIEEQAKERGLSFSHLVELGEEGEYIGFTIAGTVSGLIIGYLIPSIFEQNHGRLRRKE